MQVLRRSLQRFVWIALALVLAVAVSPTLSRLVASADPLLAARLADLCMAAKAPVVLDAAVWAAGDDDGVPTSPSAQAHCPYCLAPSLPPAWPLPERLADFDRPGEIPLPMAPAAHRLPPALARHLAAPRAPPGVS